MDLRHVASLLGGSINGRDSVSFPTPGHSPRDRGSLVTFSSDAPDGFTVHCFNGAGDLAVKDYVRERLGWRRDEPAKRIVLSSPSSRGFTEERHRLMARGTWDERGPIASTAVDLYLDSRGLAYEGDALGFHPFCHIGGEVHPAMLAAMVDIRTSAFCGVHRTALRPDGSGKATMADGGDPKRMLGPSAGAVVKLSGDDEIERSLGIAEGVETSLSLRVLHDFKALPVWACLSAHGVETFPVLPGVEAIVIAVDHDANGVGARAAQRCAERWLAAGREVVTLKPRTIGRDINDVVKERRHGRI